MALSRTKSRLTIPAPPPSPIPTGTGSRSAANETFQEFLEKSIQLPHLSLPESRFLSGGIPSPAVVDFRSLSSSSGGGGGGEAVARMLRSATDFGAFRIVNHGISGEEILSVVNEAKRVLEDCSEGNEGVVRRRFEDGGNRAAIVHVRRRNYSEASENSVVPAETYRYFSQKMENIARKLEAIAEKLSEILSETIEEQCVEKVKKGEKETIFSIYRYNHQNLFERGNVEKEERESDERENDGNVMMSLHIPGEHCQFYVNPHQQGTFCFDAGADTIVVTIGKQLQEWSLGKLNSARSEMIFVPDLLGSQSSFSIELKFSHPNLLHNPHSNVISISDQILIALLLASFYLLYTYISSFFKGK